jgi:hypothetical protein
MRNTDKNKTEMLKYLEYYKGIVTSAAAAVGINPKTHYDWLKSDVNYKQSVDMIIESQIDFVENKLFDAIELGNITAIIFYLKCKAKKRGYSEKEIIGTENDVMERLIIQVGDVGNTTNADKPLRTLLT